EADFTSDYKFQVAIEYPFNFTRSGVPVRPNFTFSGATTATYNHLTGPFGYVLSDVFDLGVTVPAGTTFGIWTTIENALGAASPAGTMPQS
ncbi:hypothetical protein, partial [Klebsiella pneumoniae]|uniref:hypothetical protein n=1 Tax=Klebsiella pneumoniae TaxID=573 RepID=UPI003B97FA94